MPQNAASTYVLATMHQRPLSDPETAIASTRTGKVSTWLEFVTFFLVTPVAVALFLPPSAMFIVLVGVTAVGMGLLHLTPGFAWRDLLEGWRRVDPWIVLSFALVTAVAAWAVVVATAPYALLALPRQMPELMLMILLLYPILSALPQEIVFRPLFFRRYGRLMPSPGAAVLVNAAVFSLAHLMFWNWIVAVMTFVGGVVFAWAYELRRSFPLAVILHAVAGNILFAMGLGIYFHSGNVIRPF